MSWTIYKQMEIIKVSADNVGSNSDIEDSYMLVKTPIK